jgi:predicted DNA-binding transcriptional regulator YafY
LAEAGVPIVGEAGLGYSIQRGYHLPPVHFTTEEATALITASLLMDRFADNSLMSPMGSALAKIRAVLPPDHQDHIARLESRMTLPTSPRPTRSASLCLIQKALAERAVLQISYRGAGKAESFPREIEPMGLTYYGDRWHLIAWCRMRKDFRDFRTDRIQELAALRERFEPRSNFSLDEFLARADQPIATLKAAIRVDPVTAERVRKEAPFKIAKEERTENDVIFAIEVGNWDWYLGWFLSFGSRVTIIEPEAFRVRLFEVAQATANHHSGAV